jgi:hypothetical protein
MLNDYRPFCKTVFNTEDTTPSRRRRDHHEGHGQHTLEDYFKSHLSWLTDAQKDDLRAQKTAGASRADLHKKVEQFFAALADGEPKEKAQAQLQSGCRELIRHVFGEEKANELRQMKESGMPLVEIGKKVDVMVCAHEPMN